MAQGNSVTIYGNITQEPELRFTPSGQAVASFTVAVNRRWQNRSTQEWEEAVSFFRCEAWRELAEHISESVTKGTRVIVVGRLEERKWDTPEGDKRSRIEIVVDDVGPSLRFATAVVSRAERTDNNTPPPATAAPAEDEEPF
jgi:single-strand DNA-binding protein